MAHPVLNEDWSDYDDKKKKKKIACISLVTMGNRLSR
jgi:hypothetical protein